MQKRGQVSAFVIIGIAVLIVIGLLFFFRDQLRVLGKQVPTQEYLDLQVQSFEKDLKLCLSEAYQQEVSSFLSQGMFDPVRSLPYQGKSIGFRCQVIVNSSSCLSEPFSSSYLEEQFASRLVKKVNDCMDLSSYMRKDYAFAAKELLIKVDFVDDHTNLEAVYPASFSRNDIHVESSPVVAQDSFPLQSLFDLGNTILKSVSEGKDVDPVALSVLSFGEQVVEVKKPYPDSLYIIHLEKYPDKKLLFAIEGEGRYARYETPLVEI